MPSVDVSLLIAVHFETTKKQLEQSIISIFEQQTTPSEIIIIKDGDITSELNQFLNILNLEKKITKLLLIEQNSGLASALNLGLKHARHDLIARLDPEDRIINDRFAKQFSFFQKNPKTVILGSHAKEFHHKNISIIKRPIKHDDIIKYLKRGNPMIHSSVMFKKKEIFQLGGYPIIHKCQDLYLWVKCSQNKYQFANIDIALIETKLDLNLLNRRNLKYYSYEKLIYKYQRKNNLISMNNYLFLIVSRFILRSFPFFLKKIFYRYR